MFATASHKKDNAEKTNNSFIQKKNSSKSANVNTFIQPKLSVGQPNDKYEQEADSIASKVVSMSNTPQSSQTTATSISATNTSQPQRKTLANTISPIVQKASNNSNKSKSTSSDISQKLNSRNGKGDTMEPNTKDYMESRFGTNFSDVRIHKDENAVQMSQNLGARAFTNGSNIYFNKGQYSPNSKGGKHLLAHELTHTIQQKGTNAVQRAIIQKQAAESTELTRLREILDQFNVPENEVIAIFGSLNSADSNTALNDSTLKEQVISALNNNQMYSAMAYSDGNIKTRLEWMFEEGTNWRHVQAVLTANTQDLATVRNSGVMRINFAGICNNRTIVIAVDALGGDLNFKLNWMAYEGANARVVFDKIRNAPSAELAATLADVDTMAQLQDDFSTSNYNRIVQMLNGLLVWEEIDTNATEKHFEDTDSDGVWEEENYGWSVNYDIEYHRDRLKIIIRIELDGETVPVGTKTAWLAGIRSRWNGHFHIEGPRRLAIEVDPEFTDDDNHTSVNVHTGSGRENSSNWYLTTTANTVAHEVGHLIGLEDEYRLSATEYTRLIGSSPTAAGSTAVPHVASGSFSSIDMIMQSGAGNVQRRHLAAFVAWLNSNRLPGEAVYRIMPGP